MLLEHSSPRHEAERSSAMYLWVPTGLLGCTSSWDHSSNGFRSLPSGILLNPQIVLHVTFGADFASLRNSVLYSDRRFFKCSTDPVMSFPLGRHVNTMTSQIPWVVTSRLVIAITLLASASSCILGMLARSLLST